MKPVFVRVICLVLIVGLFSGVVQAQQGEELPDGEDYIARYEGIPFSRTEDGGFVLGEDEAPITIVEFADFLCPHCQNYLDVSHEFVETYVVTGEAKFEYRLFPVVDPRLSPLTAQLAECANEQQEGLFFPAHDYLYELAKARLIDENLIINVVETFTLDQADLETCLETASQYVTDLRVGQAIGVNGTPASRIRLASGELGYIAIEGQIFDRGGAPIELLDIVMQTEDFASLVAIPQPLLGELVETSEICEADPCWRGLIPGETTWEDVTTFVGGQPTFTEIQLLNPQDPASTIRGISWFSIGAQSQNPSQAVTLDGETLDFIILTDLSEFLISDVFVNKGEPAFAVTNILNENFAIVDLFYPESSFIVQVLVDATVGEFSEDSQVIGAQYLSPVSMEEFLGESLLPEWIGFEGFEGYILPQ